MLKLNTFNLIVKRIICVIAIIATSIVAIFAMFYMVFIPTVVRGTSMQPTLNIEANGYNDVGERIYINRLSKCKINDIVVAYVKNYNIETSSGYIIKRLIAREGDCVDIKLNPKTIEYELLINGKVLYSKPYQNNYTTVANFASYKNNLQDKSKLTEQGLKLNKGEIFLLGDNWTSSADCSLYGPLKSSTLIGRVDIVVEKGENDFVKILKTLFK